MTHVHPAVARIADLATSDPLRRALDWAAHAEGDLADETIRVTEIAAPTFHEERRAVYVAERLQQLGLDDVTIAGDGNVYARFGDGGTPHLALLAHLDTVFAANVGVTVQRRDGRLYAPGVGDNAAGVAGLIGAIEAMRRAGTKPERPVWIVGTVGEEGLGDLSGARAAVSRLRPELSAVVAVEGSFFGRLSHVAVGSRRFRVRFRAEGGHSWHDF